MVAVMAAGTLMERAGMIHIANSACAGEFGATSNCAVVEPAWTHEWNNDLALDPMLYDEDDDDDDADLDDEDVFADDDDLGGGEDFEDDEDEDLLEEEGDDLGDDDESAEDEDDEDF